MVPFRAATNCFFVVYIKTDCTLDVRVSESAFLFFKVREPAMPNAQPVSIDREISGSTIMPLRLAELSAFFFRLGKASIFRGNEESVCARLASGKAHIVKNRTDGNFIKRRQPV